MSEHSPKIMHIVKQVEAENAGKHRDRDLPQVDGNANPRSNTYTAIQLLTGDQEWDSVIAYDEFSQRIVKQKAPPFDGGTTGAWSDADDINTGAWLTRTYRATFNTRTAAEAVIAIAEQNRFHPVRDYLNDLQWDGKSRLARLLSDYFGAKHNDYTAAAGMKTLIAAVARVFVPGCKVDTVLILEGAQGAGKSSALAILGGDWFLDTLLDLGSKDAYQAMRGKWIIELPELDSLYRSENSRIKQFFSSRQDTYRQSYGRHSKDYPRQCIFIGTVNHGEYLKDETGARRFIPVVCGAIDREALCRDRDQLFAEATELYRKGAPWWITREEAQLFSVEQDARYLSDAWENIIANGLNQEPKKQRYTVDEILTDILEIEKGRITRANQTQLGQCMQRIAGWRKVRVLMGHGRVWLYERT